MFRIVFCLLALCYGANALRGSCKIALPSPVSTTRTPYGIPFNEPVILVSAAIMGPYELFRPTGQVTTFPEGTVLHLTCLDKKNGIIITVHEIYLTCIGDDKWHDNLKKVYKWTEFECTSIPTSTVKYTGESCSNGQGKILQPGFQINNKFYPLFDICYDNVKEQTFYTHHKLNGASIDYRIKEERRPGFSSEGMTLTPVEANACYLTDNQIKRFQATFGENQDYVSKKTFLARGHLAPHADFIMRYEQFATYYYANAAPEFQDVNTGNWLRVEYQARKLASQIGRDLSSFNGYFGKFSLPHGSNRLTVNLDNAGNMPIPQYYFKVLHDEKTDSAIVFLSYNSPFEAPERLLCTNVCVKAGLFQREYGTNKSGFTYCCTLDDFIKIYNYLPVELSASNLLTSSIK